MSQEFKRHFIFILLLIATGICLTACSTEDTSIDVNAVSIEVIETLTYVPEISDTSTPQSEYIWIDDSHSDQGYIMVKYLGTHTNKIKFQITGPDQLTYTFNLETDQDFQTFPLTSGSGTYILNTFEQNSGTSYYTVDSTSIEVTIENELSPYLYPNQFVYYTDDSSVIDLSIAAATNVYSEIELISNIYNLVMDTLEYDTETAALISTGGLSDYIPDLEEIISSGKGICFDYAALMVAMLRIQEMPAKLVIGYAGGAYHAWINVYSEENGWIDEVIYFDGSEWALMDPTFADYAQNNSTINDFIGDGTNYTEKYVY